MPILRTVRSTRHALTIALAALLLLLAGVVAVRAASNNPETETIRAGVNHEGKIRLLVDPAASSPTECKQNEFSLDFATSHASRALRNVSFLPMKFATGYF